MSNRDPYSDSEARVFLSDILAFLLYGPFFTYTCHKNGERCLKLGISTRLIYLNRCGSSFIPNKYTFARYLFP